MSTRTPPKPKDRAKRPASRDSFRRSATGTFFWNSSYAEFNWNSMGYGPVGELSAFGLPFDALDAACVDPRDWGRVWFFSKDKVADYAAKEGKTLAVGPIAQHEIFKELPSSFHSSIDAAIVDDPFVLERNNQDAPVCRVVYVFAANSFVKVVLPVVEGDSLRVSAARSPSWARKPTAVLNGLGLKAGLVYIVNSEGFDVGRWDSEEMFLPLSGYSEAPFEPANWCKHSREDTTTGRPHAALPFKLVPPTAGGSRATPNGTSTVDTAKPVEDDRPATVKGIRGSRPASLGSPSDFLATLPKGDLASSNRAMDLCYRELAVVKRLTEQEDIPDFLRTFVKVTTEQAVKVTAPPGKSSGTRRCRLIYYVARDFLMLGGDADHVRVPLSGGAAQRVANYHDCMLPTGLMAKQILDATPPCQTMIYSGQGDAFGGMTSTESFLKHDEKISSDRLGCFDQRRLSAGPKKDVTVDSAMHPAGSWEPIMFWGGFNILGNITHGQANGISDPCHDHCHQEYAEAVRFVEPNAWLQVEGGEWTSCDLRDVLKSPADDTYPENLRALGLDLYKLISILPIPKPAYNVVSWAKRQLKLILQDRKLKPSKDESKTMSECQDVDTIETWISRARTATTTQEIFA
ncbi:MAG: hypothetical protein U0326_44445 [Polyangiales bacterium]